ncbi:MAG: hypothetical protein FGF50_03360 [Candidatus Brockarchaeota archaeon]|nr:hypothetical protein [Candidatus Brockarchaeota archaeon]
MHPTPNTTTLIKPPCPRESEEACGIKGPCDLYYKNPSVSLEEIINSRLHAIYVINVTPDLVSEVDSKVKRHLIESLDYLRKTISHGSLLLESVEKHSETGLRIAISRWMFG